MSLGNSAILEFLELYKEEPVIWNQNHPLHRIRKSTSEAWERIIEKLSDDFTVEDLKKKKESLMASYRLLKRRSKDNPNFRTTWFCYPLMDSFLAQIYEDSCEEDNEHEDDNGLLVPKAERVTPTPQDSSTPEQSKQAYDVDSRPAKRPYVSVPAKISSSSDNETLEELDLYCQLLLKKLKKLNERQRDLAMYEIDNILFRIKSQDSLRQPFITISPMLQNQNITQRGSYVEDSVKDDTLDANQEPED